jgi:chromosomal replication initiation ATPase DnaA
MKPCLQTGVSWKRQQEIINAVTANPLASYVFAGPPGVGKTTLLQEVARLARAAQWKNFALYSKTAMQYQSDVTAAARGERVSVVRPEAFDNDARLGIRWGIFLDDVDKVSGSEFIRLQLFGLLNAATQERTPTTQLVMTTNMRQGEFAKFFGDQNAWRVVKHCVWVPMEREG